MPIKTKKKQWPVPGPLGGAPGSGRTPKALQLKKYTKVLSLLDENVEEAFDVMKMGMKHPDPWVRIRCAEWLLNKYIPTKKIKEITGKDGGPIELNAANKRDLILEVVDLLEKLDDKDFDGRIDHELSGEILDAEYETSEE